MLSTWRKPAFGLAVLLVGAACRGSPKAQDGAGPIRIGLIVSLTGNYSALGTEDEKAVRLAVEQVNAAGGLLGRKVELLTRNDETRPDQAVLAFNDVKGAGIVAMIGPVFSNAALAIEPLAERAGMPYLSLAPAQEQVQPIRSHVFVVPALSAMYAERFLQYLQAEDKRKIAVAYDSKSAYSVAGHAAIVPLAPKYGIEIVRDEAYETTTTDFGPLFTHVRDSDAQVLVFWGSGAPGITVTKQYASSGLKIPLFLTASQASRLWLDPVGGAAEGLTVESAIGVVGKFLPDGPQKKVVE
ncbi:MAG: ABC transporter substrate-binding protein, partial [Myxococcales bacterium]|nr:ABC transporter substrate-binding protein [Myxococcales bacterium]